MKKTKIKTVKIEDADQQEKEKKKLEKKEIKKEESKSVEKEEKKSNIFKEIRAFVLLALIVLSISFGCWYWYTHIYNGDREIPSVKEEKKESGYRAIKYTSALDNKLDMINDKYIIEYKKDKLVKVMDIKTNLLYEGEIEFDEIIEGVDNNLYILKYDEADYENIVTIYKLEDNEFNFIKKLATNGIYYRKISYKDRSNNYDYLVGFTGYKEGYNEEDVYEYKSYIYSLEDKEYELENNILYGDEYLESKENIVTYNDRYLVVAEVSNGARFKQFGLYDIKENKIVINPQYEGLYTNTSDTYIAIKGGKAGIINNKLKKIVDFEYDFIDRNDGYYIVAKNSKMAIMDLDYKVISKYDFNYQDSSKKLVYNYFLSDEKYNTFISKKVNDKYVLTINNMELQDDVIYDKHETYIINSDGTYKVITANEFFVDDYSSLIYSYDLGKKIYTFYDSEFNEKINIDISDYDYTGRPEVKLLNENVISVGFDSHVYFDYETGEEVKEMKDYSSTINGIVISFNAKSKKISYQVEGKEVANVDGMYESVLNLKSPYFKQVSDKEILYMTKNEYVYIEKGE